MTASKNLLCLLFLLAGIASGFSVQAQCPVAINNFPYNQDFENSDGNWTAGGNNSDWVWGTPAKSIITGAGGGLKCWIVGGLVGNSYNGGEASFLQSPCFDFSSLQYPYISFKVFWETEKRFDGASLQYSTDLGASWTNVGSASDAFNCINSFWFNYSPITYLGSLSTARDGWSGCVQQAGGGCVTGDGSSTWRIAQHTMPYLAGQPSVTFRFIFGAGTQCNNFNGFAVDDIAISEAPANDAHFTYTCAGNNTVQFTSTSGLCPTTYSWDFDDPTSGDNSSTGNTPIHMFSGPGTYQVKLTVGGPDNAPSSITLPVTVIGVTATVTRPLRCFGDQNAIVQASVTGATTPLNYSWNTNPVQQTASIQQLAAGSYTVTVSGANICSTSATAIVTAPTKIIQGADITQPNCNRSTGAVALDISGGQAPYLINWQPNVSNSALASNLAIGNYLVTVLDAQNCKDTAQLVIQKIVPTLVIGSTTPVDCKGNATGSATAVVVAGIAPLTYSWNTPTPQTNLTAAGLVAGSYRITATDAEGCTGFADVNITEPLAVLSANPSISNSTCGYADGNIVVNTSGGTGPYQYLWTPSISNNNTAANILSGTYAVRVADNRGCKVDLTNLTVPNIGTPAKPRLGKDTTICGDNASLQLKPGNFSSYRWQDNTSTPIFTVTSTGNYFVTVANSEGCIGTDSILVKVEADCGEVFFPGSFTPNADGRNDWFHPVGNVAEMSAYQLTVYNRFGQVIFISNNPFTGWDGTIKGDPGVLGAYVWTATYTFKKRLKRQQKGTVVLIR